MASQLPPMNPWEAQAINHGFPDQTESEQLGLDPSIPRSQDPLIFPGLYCPSGFDIMSILLQVKGRPYPTIELGPIDGSVSLVLCDLELPDAPIVYASDSFLDLTGYSRDEVLGRNCRFLQTPGGTGSAPGPAVDKAAVQRISQAVHANQEIQIEIDNYKKNGQYFTNILSIIPIEIGSHPHRYAVGFQCEA